LSNVSFVKLSKSRKNTVFGEGDLNAKIFFHWRSPGGLKILPGRPFVGKCWRGYLQK